MRAIIALGLTVLALAAGPALSRPQVSLVGAYAAPKDLAVDGAPFGGISGIDHDPATGDWLMISDDRSDKAPARFYRARLTYDARGISVFELNRRVALRQENGETFPPTKSPTGERVDAEALRRDPLNGQIVWASEGDPTRGFSPSLRRMDVDGASLGRIALPAGLAFDPAGKSGPRANQTLEGVSFSPDGRSIWISMEGPLIQDGPASSVRDGGLARITRLDREGRPLAQYAYPLDPIQAAPREGMRADNGISEILAVDQHRLLVLERSGVEVRKGHFVFHCRLYLVDTRGARDVADREVLDDAPPPLTKRLLVNFAKLGRETGNLEAMAWGPPLRDGRRALVLMADDNFDPDSPGSIVVLAIAGL
jgi:hypothetical protein